MKSKFIRTAILFVAIALVFALVACGGNDAEKKLDSSSYTVTTTTNMYDAGTFTQYQNTEKAPGTEVKLSAAANDGYSFLGWYEGETLLSEDAEYVFTMPEANKNVVAKFAEFLLTTEASDALGGTITFVSSQRTSAGATRSLEASNKVGYIWSGWFDGSERVSMEKSFTYTMPKKSVTLTAKFEKCVDHELNNECTCTKCGLQDHSTKMSADGYCKHTEDGVTYVYFGLYPQTVKAQDVQINGAKDADGYFIGSDGNKYAEAKYEPPVNSIGKRYFSNGEEAVKDATYYFKVEPVRWDVIKTENGESMLLSQKVIDSRVFLAQQWIEYRGNLGGKNVNVKIEAAQGPLGYSYANNYEYSDLREWLVGDFYDKAFSATQKALMKEKVVVNSDLTGIASEYVSRDVTDKVYVLSSSEFSSLSFSYKNKNYTDFAMAHGAQWSYNNSYASFWTRTPYAESSTNNERNSLYLKRAGYSIGAESASLRCGVAPIVWIEE